MSVAQETVKAIDEGYSREKREKARDYIGASGVGSPCDADLAYSLRGFPNTDPDPRLKRIFRLGHILEDEVVRDLKLKADVRVWEKDGLTGRQHTYSELGGHVVCHMDGHIELDDGVLRVLEIKSMNEASFKKFQKDGVKISHPRYYAQLQMMMGMSNIPSSFFISVCKNNSEYHAEIVEFDELEWSYIRQRVERVLANQAAKISVDETDWRCRGCFKRGVCWEGAEVPKTCMTCQHAFANRQGSWHCSKHDEEAVAACDQYQKYEPIPREA